MDCEQVRGILAGLPENHRDALVMRSLNGLSHEEMAERMSMTAPQVKALIHRAKGSFRRAWGSRGGAGVFFPAFLWKIPLPRFVRKFLGLGVDSTPGSVGGAVASPAVSMAGSATSERVSVQLSFETADSKPMWDAKIPASTQSPSAILNPTTAS